jgi:eukaryotic-like serine/threonine-protein kinase
VPLTAGDRLGTYEILAPIGQGVDEVFRARDTRLNRDVAIKVLPPLLISDPPAPTRAERRTRQIFCVC